jgi:hypothetical protein
VTFPSLSFVIPAKAGIRFDPALFCSKNRATTRPSDERVTFFACAKKATKESPPVARLPGILPLQVRERAAGVAE